MQVSRKSVRDFVRDVRSQPVAKDASGNPAPVPDPAYQPNLTIHPTITRERIWGKGANQPLDVEVYSIAPGEQDSPHYHPDHVELVICWRGTGKATITDPATNQAHSFSIQRGDSVLVPKGALHRFEATTKRQLMLPNPANPPVPIGPSMEWPSEKLELIVIHAHGSVRVADDHAVLQPQTPSDDQLYSMMRPIGNFCGYARDVRLQCVRARIWGREAERNVKGDADNAKSTLHFTAYTFVPGQENPEHYHPRSVEFVMCLQGRANMTVRPMIKPGDFTAGWEDPCDVCVLEEGDTVLVPMGALHWYENAGNEDCVLVALQSPHPILHILEDDAPVEPAA